MVQEGTGSITTQKFSYEVKAVASASDLSDRVVDIGSVSFRSGELGSVIETVESGNRPTVNTRSALIAFHLLTGKASVPIVRYAGSASGSDHEVELLCLHPYADTPYDSFKFDKASSGGIGGPGSSNLIGSDPHKYWAIRPKNIPKSLTTDAWGIDTM